MQGRCLLVTGTNRHLCGVFAPFSSTLEAVKDFGVVNEAEVDAFLELSCFVYDPTDIGNLISGSSSFSKSSSNIWKFLVHILLKPHLENFEHYFATCEMSAIVS